MSRALISSVFNCVGRVTNGVFSRALEAAMSFGMAGFTIGHATNDQFHTGCTVILCPEGAIGSVEVRGPGPGTREVALLAPDRPVHKVNAVVLTGGSAFGLATADGVMRYLAEQGAGHFTPIRPIPIVAAAVVYDLFLSRGDVLPDADMGYAACLNASKENDLQGNVGAGAGVTLGKWAGPGHLMKGGFGLASQVVDDLVVCAAAVVNSIGDIIDVDGTILAGARAEDGGWLAHQNPLRYVAMPVLPPSGTNTTLVVVGTNAILDKVEAFRVAQRAHDGIAVAVRPAHMSHEGDAAFVLATEKVNAPFELVANAAAETVAEAIRNAARWAESVESIPGMKDWP